MVPDVVNPIRRRTLTGVWTITTPTGVSLSRLIKNSDDPFSDVVDVGKVPLHLAKIEDLDRLVLDDGLGEEKQGHIGTTPGTVHGKKAKATAGHTIEMRIAMSHEFIGFFRRRVERD